MSLYLFNMKMRNSLMSSSEEGLARKDQDQFFVLFVVCYS